MFDHSIDKRYDKFDDVEDKEYIKKLKKFQKNYEKMWINSYCSAIAGGRSTPIQIAKTSVKEYFEQFGKPNNLYYSYKEYEIIKNLNDI